MRISDWSSDVCSSDLEAVADVRKCAPHDHAHGVIEVTAAHLVLEIDGDDFLGELGHCDSFRCGSGACPAPRKTVSHAPRHKRGILARNTLPMPDYSYVETRTSGVFLSAGRALAKRGGKTRPVLHRIRVEAASAGALDLTGPVPKTRG